MSPGCLYMVYGCPLCTLAPRPQFSFSSYMLLGYCSFFVVVAYIVFFLHPPCISGHGAFRGGIRVLYFHFVFIGE